MLTDPRLVLERLCAERGEDFAGLSRMLGRNPAYIQQFVRRGVPKRLKEEERRKLARYFAVSESLARRAGRTSRRSRRPGQRQAPSGARSRPGPGAIVTEELGKPYFAFDERWLKALTPSAAGQPVDRSGRRQFDGADAERRRRHPGRPRRCRRAAARRHLRAAGRRCAGGQAARAPPGRPAGDGPVGQSGLSRLARLRPRRDQLHRPGDLVGPARSSSRLARRSISHRTSASSAPIAGADQDALHRIADREAGDEAGEDAQGEETSSGRAVGRCIARAMPERVPARPSPKHGQRRVDDICRQSRNGRAG